MKLVKSVTSLFILAALAVAVSSIPASAQQSVTRVEIPFEFKAAGKALPAGIYTIEMNAADGIFTIVDAYGHKAWLRGKQIAPLQNNRNARLVFHRSGEEYALQSLWLTPGGPGYQIPASKKTPGDRMEIAFAH